MDSHQGVMNLRLRTAYNLILGPNCGRGSGCHSVNICQTSVLEVAKELLVFVYHNNVPQCTLCLLIILFYDGGGIGIHVEDPEVSVEIQVWEVLTYKIFCNVVCQIGSTWTNSGSLNIDIDNLSISGFRGTSRSSTSAPSMNQLAVSSPTSPMHPQLAVNRSPGMQHFYPFLCLVPVLHFTATFITFQNCFRY